MKGNKCIQEGFVLNGYDAKINKTTFIFRLNNNASITIEDTNSGIQFFVPLTDEVKAIIERIFS